MAAAVSSGFAGTADAASVSGAGTRAGDFNGDGRDDVISWLPTYPDLVAWVAQSQYGVAGVSNYYSFGPATVWHNKFPSTGANVAPLSVWFYWFSW